jgi:glycolate oxidase iron-sulfur subunit
MQTNFSLAQLADPDVKASEAILRKCVHCGFCTATCPTYTLLGDELDSPRGRIYLMQDMLERDVVEAAHVRHVDRCLSCLSCMTTCPSGVHYMHLVDHARTIIEQRYDRPLGERLLRDLLGWLIPRPTAFRWALLAALPGRVLAPLLPPRWAAMLRLAPARLPSPALTERTEIFNSVGPRRARVALLAGCAQQVLAPEINDATIRLLTRHRVEVVVAPGSGCCGSLNHHLGQHDAALALAKADIRAWTNEIEDQGLDAIVINASGCGTTVKDYGFMFRDDPEWAAPAARVSALARDVTEFMTSIGLAAPSRTTGQRVAYHSACSMQHGQKLREEPKALLAAAGFAVIDVPEGHLCCGSAGTYNLLQPELAERLRERKLANIASTAPALVATGNIGCMTQLADGAGVPVVHTVELLDWATGGPAPRALTTSRCGVSHRGRA